MNKKIIISLLLAGCIILSSCGKGDEKPQELSSDIISASSELSDLVENEISNSDITDKNESSESKTEEDNTVTDENISEISEENSQMSSNQGSERISDIAPDTDKNITEMIDVSLQFIFGDNKPVSNSKIKMVIKEWNTKWEEGEGFFSDYVTDADGNVKIRIPKELLKNPLEFKVVCNMPDGTEQNENISISLIGAETMKSNIVKLKQNSYEQYFKNYKNKVIVKVTKNGKPIKNLNISFNDLGQGVPSLDEQESESWNLKYSNQDGEAYFVNPQNTVYFLSIEDENFELILEADIDLTSGAFDETVSTDNGYEINVKYTNK